MGFNRRSRHQLAITCLSLAFVFCANTLFAQEVADKIAAIVGKNRIILQSDIEIQIAQAKAQDPNFTDSNGCNTLATLISSKMLMEQAERDSVRVSDEDVEGQLDNRLRYFTQMYGSKEKLEKISGKTIYQLKEDYRDVIKDQMLAEKVQGTVLENVKITPAEVAEFYKKIPVDSLPFFPATVEVGQIVMDPKVSQEMEDYAHEKIEKIRKDIVVDGKSFEAMAGIYSEDPGSRDNGGRYDGITRNGPWVAEFIAATFKLQNGEISPIIKTKFGYHIIQMINRKGDEADVRHILIKPTVTNGDYQKALGKLDSIRAILVSGKMSFQEAVGKFSTDDAAKRTGGMIADPSTGVTELDMSKLDPVMVMLLDSMKQGDFSASHIFVNDQHEKSCRIIFLRSRTAPHKANLKEDYGKIQEVALAQKKRVKLNTWITSKIPTYYLKVAPEYESCGLIKEWLDAIKKAN